MMKKKQREDAQACWLKKLWPAVTSQSLFIYLTLNFLQFCVQWIRALNPQCFQYSAFHYNENSESWPKTVLTVSSLLKHKSPLRLTGSAIPRRTTTQLIFLSFNIRLDSFSIVILQSITTYKDYCLNHSLFWFSGRKIVQWLGLQIFYMTEVLRSLGPSFIFIFL